MIPGRKFFGPLFLVMAPPVAVMLVWYTNFHLDGSFSALFESIWNKGFLTTLSLACESPFDPKAWKIIGTYILVQALVMRLVPGKEFIGPTSPTGHVPKYTENGVACFFVSLSLFFAGVHFGLYNGGIVYDNSGQLLSSMNLFSLIFVAFLYIKGRTFPSTPDCGHTGNIVFDYYWGTELYPRIFGWDVK